MKKIFFLVTAIALVACNNSKKEPATGENKNENNSNVRPTVTPSPSASAAGESGIVYTANGVVIKHSASILVTKDKDKLQDGAPFLCMLTSNAAANNNEYVAVNFLMDTKPGNYPVVGCSFQRGTSPNDEMYGGLLGGKPRLTGYTVTITECRDLGDNKMGGHKWSLTGYWENISIKAMPIMLTDKSKGHPAEVMLGKGSFYNLTFDDNWEEMLEEGLKKMK